MVSGKFYSDVYLILNTDNKVAFLRTLEYFNGIIFMTTNRLGTMDHAFQSRIQYATEYTALSTVTRRKIWKLFIERLENLDSREELLEDTDYLKKLDLNGRQIRNAMKLAQSLALQERREMSGETIELTMKMAPLKKRHVRQAAKEMLSLQQYFKRKKESSHDEIGASLGDQRRFEVNIRGQGQTPVRNLSDQDE
jgi:AAA+ superfamily predicted ATPase